MGGVGGAIGALVLVVYLVLITNEGDDSFWEVAPWVTGIGVATASAAIGTVAAPRRLGRRLMLIAGVMFVAIGVPAIFSVGSPLILAGVLCLVASSLVTS